VTLQVDCAMQSLHIPYPAVCVVSITLIYINLKLFQTLLFFRGYELFGGLQNLPRRITVDPLEDLKLVFCFVYISFWFIVTEYNVLSPFQLKWLISHARGKVDDFLIIPLDKEWLILCPWSYQLTARPSCNTMRSRNQSL